MLAHAPDNLLDTGRKSGGAGNERLCVATRTVKPVAEMIRYVVAPDGSVVPDLKRKLPGRGIWVTATRSALAEAIKRQAVARAFKREVRVGADLVPLTERLLERAALDALAMCGKARLVAVGFAKAEAALARGPVVALVHAAGAAQDGVRKLDAALRRRFGDAAARIPIIAEFGPEQLDLALARPNVVHAALLTGTASDTFLSRRARLQRFRTGDPAAGVRHGAEPDAPRTRIG